MEVKSDNGRIVSCSSCDRLGGRHREILCVLYVCAFQWRPCGANVTAGWSHLTNHDIMVSTGPFPSPLALPSVPPFISTDAELPVSVGQSIPRLHTQDFLYFFLSSFSFCLLAHDHVLRRGKKVFPANRQNERQQSERPGEKRNARRMVGLCHLKLDRCLLLPGTALTEAHPQYKRKSAHAHIPPKLTTHTYTPTHK